MSYTRFLGAGALTSVLTLALPDKVRAQDVDGGVSLAQPAATLIMPFDNTAGRASFQIVSRIGRGAGSEQIATHWSYWSHDCRHLVDVFVCLTPDDTKVMDPVRVQSEIQAPNPPVNAAIGSVTDLTGERGLTTVTAYRARTGPSRRECLADPASPLENELVGGWTIADTVTGAAFGADAIGVASDLLPDANLIVESGLVVQTFNPVGLGDSSVILLGVEVEQGSGAFRGEIGPIRRDRRADGAHVCCSLSFTDDLEITTSLPDLCWECAGFHPISAAQRRGEDTPVIPANTSIDAPGFLRLRDCRVGDPGTGAIVDLGEPAEQFIFAIHGQAIGPFGVGLHGKYTGESF